MVANGGVRRAVCSALLVCLACSTTSWKPTPDSPRVPLPRTPVPQLEPGDFDFEDVKVQPQGQTVEQNWVLDLYTFFHSRNYSSYRVLLPGSQEDEVTAHLLIPAGPGPHPVVVLFPILEGSHVVSEGMAKALVNRGYAAARLERHELELAKAKSPEVPALTFRSAILDARRLLDWLVTHPRLDPERIAAAGVSMGGILALTLMGVEPRIRAGFFVSVGGDLPQIFYDSSERPVKIFRKRLQDKHSLSTREEFASYMQPYVESVDPLTYAKHIDPRDVLLVSGRCDRVVRPRHTRNLWEALGRPTWTRYPAGHYQLAPFFWWAVGRGAKHLDRVFAEPAG